VGSNQPRKSKDTKLQEAGRSDDFYVIATSVKIVVGLFFFVERNMSLFFVTEEQFIVAFVPQFSLAQPISESHCDLSGLGTRRAT
jgi:hypothetical protein